MNDDPAFPTLVMFDEKWIDAREGMTLRDYFAAHVPAQVLQGHIDTDGMAYRAYQWADALLKAGELSKGEKS